jgi:hypothetical protein
MLAQRLYQMVFPFLVDILLFTAFLSVAVLQGVNKISRLWRRPHPG